MTSTKINIIDFSCRNKLISLYSFTQIIYPKSLPMHKIKIKSIKYGWYFQIKPRQSKLKSFKN